MKSCGLCEWVPGDQPNYKLFPATWRKRLDELPGALDTVLKDSRFAEQSCCLRKASGTVSWYSPKIDAHGDPTLEFDTGVMWRRAGEIMCAKEPMVGSWGCSARGTERRGLCT
jgi:hypothetical protein